MLTPQQKAEAARQRILKAVGDLGVRRISRGRIERLPFSAIAAALLGGFVVGYSHRARRIFLQNIDGVLRFLADFRV